VAILGSSFSIVWYFNGFQDGMKGIAAAWLHVSEEINSTDIGASGHITNAALLYTQMARGALISIISNATAMLSIALLIIFHGHSNLRE